MVVKIYTDGACSGNPGHGGYGAIICLPDKTKEISGYEKETTNNRMELKSVVMALLEVYDMIFQEKYKNIEKLEIFSDSAYVVNAINKKWLEFWKNNDFKTTSGNPVKNSDLWLSLIDQMDVAEFIKLDVSFIKVKGHAGNYFNEKVDKIAKNEIRKVGKGNGCKEIF